MDWFLILSYSKHIFWSLLHHQDLSPSPQLVQVATRHSRHSRLEPINYSDTGSSTSVVLVEDKNHRNAEKKRKGTIKNGFDMLRSVVPSLSLLPTIKISKAAQLNKAAEFIIQLKEDNDTIQNELKTLCQSVEILQQDIRCSHTLLPSRGKTKWSKTSS